MALRRLWHGVGISAALLMAIPRCVSAAECLTLSFSGCDPALETAAIRQIQTELKIPIYPNEGPDNCWRLSIILKDNASRISLNDTQTSFDTTLRLADFPPSLWPRAMALSTSGLWILAHEPTTETDQVTPSTEPSERKPPERSSSRPVKSLTQPPDRSRAPLYIHILTGGRLFPTLETGLVELSTGTDITFSAIHLGISLVGLFGKKSITAGQILTAGVGLRASVFWRAVNRQRISMGIGPAAELIAVFGKGEGKQGIKPNQGGSPVVNLLLLLGGWLELSPRISAHAAVGGGYSVIYFEMQQDGKTVSGMNGGSANLIAGLSFGSLN